MTVDVGRSDDEAGTGYSPDRKTDAQGRAEWLRGLRREGSLPAGPEAHEEYGAGYRQVDCDRNTDHPEARHHPVLRCVSVAVLHLLLLGTLAPTGILWILRQAGVPVAWDGTFACVGEFMAYACLAGIFAMASFTPAGLSRIIVWTLLAIWIANASGCLMMLDSLPPIK